MANDVAIRDASGSVRQVSALETSVGKVTQRQLVQTIVGGAPTDVSTAAPLPVEHSGPTAPLTNPQLRAAPVAVETELPTAAPLADEQDNTSVPTVGVRVALWNPTTGKLTPARSTAADGGGQAPRNSAAATTHNYDATASAVIPQRSARSLGDAESGASFAGVGNMLFETSSGFWRRAVAARTDGTGHVPANVAASSTHLYDTASARAVPAVNAASVGDTATGAGTLTAGTMLYNGTTWERDRTGQAPVTLLAEAARSTTTYMPATLCPGRLTRAVFALRIVASDPAKYLEMRILDPSSNIILAGLRIPAAAAAGVYGLSLGAGATTGAAVNTGSQIVTTPGNYMCGHHLAPVPRSLSASYVAPETGGTWTYSVAVSYLP